MAALRNGGHLPEGGEKPADYLLAIAAYEEALKVAPWWGDAYHNLSISLESAGRFTEAQAALKLYLLTRPADAETAQNRLYALDAKKTLAARDVESELASKRAAVLAAEDARRAETSIEGAWFIPDNNGVIYDVADIVVTRKGDAFELKTSDDPALYTIRLVHASETTLRFALDDKRGRPFCNYDLRREGSYLVGDWTILRNDLPPTRVRAIRKPAR